jgi:putative oxidoreductase
MLAARIDGFIVWAGRLLIIPRAIAPVAARLVVGQSLFFSGWAKVHKLPEIVDNFVGWGVPFPGLLAPATSFIELLGGLALVFGCGTRLAAGALIGVLVGALSTADRKAFLGAWQLVPNTDPDPILDGVAPIIPLVFMFWLIAYGPGLLSIDTLIRLWWRKLRQPGSAALPGQTA